VRTYLTQLKKLSLHTARHASHVLDGVLRVTHRVSRIAPHVSRFALAALLVTFTLYSLRPILVAADEPIPLQPVVLQAGASGVILEWRAPAFSQQRVVGDDGRSYVALDAPGWDHTELVGQPQLPKTSVLAVVPHSGDVTLSVRVLARERHKLSHPVAPSPQSVAVGSPPVSIGRVWARDAKAYANVAPHFQSLYPRESSDVVTLEEAGWLRGRRLVRLTFFPMHFVPASSVPGRVDGPSLEVARHVRLELRFENAAIGTQTWSGDDPFTSVLQDAVVNPTQVTQFVPPRRVAPAPSTPASPPADTEYLIITHSDFITAVAPLAAHRAISDGLRVFSTTVEAIYDVYSEGVVTATAIRDYISDAYHAPLSPTLTYVLLVGDGTTDVSGDQYIPPYTIILDPPWWPGEPLSAASDNRFVAVDGADNLADVFIGRLPVNNVNEATTVVEKILSYELAPPQWPWNERVLFFAGNEDPDDGETFHDDSDWLYNHALPATFTGQRVYFCTDDCTAPYHYENITAAREATVREIDFGGLLASYVGHSSRHQWAVEPDTYDPMFHLDDVANLHNGKALPVILEMTCYTSDFSHPAADTLDESLLRRSNGGAVATWGPTTLGRTSGHNVLQRAFFDALFAGGVTELGTLIKTAEIGLLEGEDLDLLDTFILLGDPAMDLNLTVVSWSHEVFLPVTLRGN
jgi:hypothetical protein